MYHYQQCSRHSHKFKKESNFQNNTNSTLESMEPSWVTSCYIDWVGKVVREDLALFELLKKFTSKMQKRCVLLIQLKKIKIDILIEK